MIKVLHIVEAFGGGVVSFMEALLNEIHKEFEVIVLYSKRPLTPEHFMDLFSFEIKFIEIKNLQRSVNFFKDIKAGFEIRDLVNEINPDVIHLHSSKAGVLGRFFINCKKYSVFYTPHGYSFLQMDNSKIERIIYKYIENMMGFTKAVTIGCSIGEYEIAKKISRKAVCINNGIKLDKLPTTISEKFCNDNPKICSLGRIYVQKSPSVFAEVAKAMPRQEFVWIGDGELRSTIDYLPNVHVTGWMTREKALDYLMKMDVLLLLSYGEGLPNALLEAMYLGKICIASNVVGIKDVIVHGVNGFIVDSPQDVKVILNNIISGKIEVEKIRYQAKKDVDLMYSSKVMGENYAKQYRKSIDK